MRLFEFRIWYFRYGPQGADMGLQSKGIKARNVDDVVRRWNKQNPHNDLYRSWICITDEDNDLFEVSRSDWERNKYDNDIANAERLLNGGGEK